MITSLNLQDKQRDNIIRKIKSSKTEKRETKVKPKSAKTKIKRNLNVKKILKTKSKDNKDSQYSQDNKGD